MLPTIELVETVHRAYVNGISNNYEDGKLRLLIVFDRVSIVFALRSMAVLAIRV